MDNERKTIAEFKAEERRQERAQNRRAFFQRLVGIFKFILVMTILAIAIHHRAQIQKVCYSMFEDAMQHIRLSSQTRQKAADYQQQIDGVTTN